MGFLYKKFPSLSIVTGLVECCPCPEVFYDGGVPEETRSLPSGYAVRGYLLVD